jgi:hypothetical protein
MNHEERKAIVKGIDEQLATDLEGKPTKAQKSEAQYRWRKLRLLADIADSQDSLAACYRKMLAIQEAKTAR